MAKNDSGKQPVVSVIVPARDATATLSDTLDGIGRQEFDAPFEVIVVDNGSNDETAALAERHPLQPRVIRRKRGEGAGAARNEGARAASGSVLAFVDSDCAPDSRWLAEGMRAIVDADIVIGPITPVPGVPVGPFDRTLWVEHDHGLYETANMLVRREWFDRLNGFEDWVPERGVAGAAGRPFGEDAWFVWRARRLGATTQYARDAIVHHAVFPGRARDYITEQWRLRLFPQLVALIPELRDSFAWHRYFLNERTARLDLAVAGGVAALAVVSPVPLVAAAPYALFVAREVKRSGWRGSDRVKLGAIIVARDVVGLAGLLVGTIKARKPLL